MRKNTRKIQPKDKEVYKNITSPYLSKETHQILTVPSSCVLFLKCNTVLPISLNCFRKLFACSI